MIAVKEVVGLAIGGLLAILSSPVRLLWISKTIANDHVVDRSLCTFESPFYPPGHSQVSFYVCCSHVHLSWKIFGFQRCPRYLKSSQGVSEVVTDRTPICRITYSKPLKSLDLENIPSTTQVSTNSLNNQECQFTWSLRSLWPTIGASKKLEHSHDNHTKCTRME